AALAGTLHAPLFVYHGREDEAAELRDRLTAWNAKEVFVVGETADNLPQPSDLRLVPLADEQAVAAAYLPELAREGPGRNGGARNAADTTREKGGMSVLAPWIAVQRRAALVLTNEDGTDATAAVTAAVKNPEMKRADTLIVVASLRAIPVEKRPNPV